VTVNFGGSFFDHDHTPTLLHEQLTALLRDQYRLAGSVAPDDTEVRPYEGEFPKSSVLFPFPHDSMFLWQRRDAPPDPVAVNAPGGPRLGR
jgi:hypothetical protein